MVENTNPSVRWNTIKSDTCGSEPTDLYDDRRHAHKPEKLDEGLETYREKFLRIFVHDASDEAVRSIKLRSLTFTDKQLEKEFGVSKNTAVAGNFVTEAVLICILGSITSLLTYGTWDIIDGQVGSTYWSFIIYDILTLAVALSLFFVDKVPFVKNHLELLFYLSGAFVLTCFLVFQAYIFTANEVTPKVLFEISTWISSLWSLTFVCAVILFNFLVPSRFKFGVWFNCYLGLLAFGIEYFGWTPFRRGEHYVAVLMRAFLYISVLLFATVARYSKDAEERVDFFHKIQYKRKFQELKLAKEEEGKIQQKGEYTPLEDLVSKMKNAEAMLQDALATSHDDYVKDAADIINESIKIIRTSANLYGADIEAQTKEASDIIRMLNNQNAAAPQTLKSVLFKRDSVTLTHSSTGLSVVTSLESHQPGTMKRSDRCGTLAMMAYEPDIAELCVAASAEPLSCTMYDTLRNKVGREWSFDIHNEVVPTTNNVILEIGCALLLEKLPDLGVSEFALRHLLNSMDNLYYDNPYHNNVHGATVANCTVSMMNFLTIGQSTHFNTYNYATLVVSCLAHDICHPGLNNAFFINTIHPLAILYNDISVLENFHATSTFALLAKPECNIFISLMPEEFRTVRMRIIELILSTDMKQHFNTISKFRIRRQAAEFDYLTNEADMWLMLNVCMKAADLSHASFEWTQHFDWSLRAAEEFYQQGDLEADIGLPKSPLCDRNNHSGFAKSQKGFIEFVVEPMFKEIEQAHSTDIIGVECIQKISYNKCKWEEYMKSEEYIDLTLDITSKRNHLDEMVSQLGRVALGIASQAAVDEICSISMTKKSIEENKNKNIECKTPKPILVQRSVSTPFKPKDFQQQVSVHDIQEE